MAGHRKRARQEDSAAGIYKQMRTLGVEHFRIVLIQKCPCTCKDELWAVEEKHRASVPRRKILNIRSAQRTQESYAAARQKSAARGLTMKACQCGSTVTRQGWTQHLRTLKHKNWAKANNIEFTPPPVQTRAKDSIDCPCGGRFLEVQKRAHILTSRHQHWLATKNNCPPCTD